MKNKKAVSLILVIVLSLSFCFPVLAAEKTSYIDTLITQLREVVDALEAVIAMLEGIGGDDDAAEAVEEAADKVAAEGFQIGQKFGKGMYRVGSDIPAGEYRIKSEGGYCSYTTYSDSTGSYDSRLEGSYTDTFGYFTIKPDAKYFEFSGNGTAEYLGPVE